MGSEMCIRDRPTIRKLVSALVLKIIFIDQDDFLRMFYGCIKDVLRGNILQTRDSVALIRFDCVFLNHRKEFSTVVKSYHPSLMSSIARLERRSPGTSLMLTARMST